ncbi:MAG: gamma-glutamylcyclotransferase family protein, partial [Halobacteria archaeon]|nr:gamma-glutamylcyclotransferase family protein [Halobacteria archaeon]
IYDLGDYPGLKTDSAGSVAGELYRVGEDAISEIDEFEGYYPGEPERSVYLREKTELLDRPTKAWVYVYAGEVEESWKVESGDWRRYRGEGNGK